MIESTKQIALYVWDIPTRLFHWSLVVLVLAAWATAESDSQFLFNLHLAAGYGVIGLLIFRVIWGFFGTRHALFRSFVRSWSVVRDYSRRLLAFRPPSSVGHNPLGGWMVILLLLVLAAIVGSGLFAGSEKPGGEFAGPLARLIPAAIAGALRELHEGLFNILIVLVCVHIAGVVTDILLTRDNLIAAMIRGTKMVPAETAGQGAAPTPVGRAVIAALVAVAATAVIVLL